MRTAFLPFFLVALFLLNACNLDIEQPEATPGTGNFSRYMAVGSSFTAGYTGDGLTRYGQEHSYPAFLAQQFALAGGGSFNQPLLPGGTGSGEFKLMGLSVDSCGNALPNLVKQTPNPAWETNVSAAAPFNNMGIPNIKVGDVNNAIMYLLNSYLKRVVPPGTTYLQALTGAVETIQPTYFTNWLGITDALGYAATGGGYTGNTPISLFALTDTITFANNYAQILDVLTAGGAKGMVFTIPLLTDFPFFNTVPYRAQGPDSCSHVLDIFITASNGIRKATSNPNALFNDLILLPAAQEIGRPDTLLVNGEQVIAPYGLSAANPLAHDLALDRTEAQNCVLTIRAYNRAIRAAAAARNIPVIET
ncbi:MAG TPA: hypothetical protein PK715_08885, partial [Chitinophagales bacterium]|nr:hypothetical protein [Chitinophagales bacterium]